MNNSKRIYLITCEHGGNDVPIEYRPLFSKQANLLNSHKGFDIGALNFAKKLARKLSAKLLFSTVTRLLVDLNRSAYHRNLFSEITKYLPEQDKERILDKYYLPYRKKVTAYIQHALNNGKTVIHISTHSFTPTFNGQSRGNDIGLLYDPSRKREQRFCANLKSVLEQNIQAIIIRRNYPYLGKADGLTTALRSRYAERYYSGIELEINQGLMLAGEKNWKAFEQKLAKIISRGLLEY